ncbi:hypothetical protein ANN_14430 [Periplaneta americana]|uniref:Uncharacterized protein n=1 Tax=Periplaneta americana TaxID=6978 RepID=A0ABQ8SXQ9_PERAM|nr:hypothetical protein ANN_14430 [Periplaneta americana]
MADHEIPKKVMGNKFEGKRSVGRPRLRWMDGVLEDLKKVGIKGWWLVARDRDTWKRVLRRPRLKLGCSADDVLTIDVAQITENHGRSSW